MENSFKALKAIGTVAIASFTFVTLPLSNTPVEAAESQPQLNFVLLTLETDAEREVEMTLEDAAYLQALREHYDCD